MMKKHHSTSANSYVRPADPIEPLAFRLAVQHLAEAITSVLKELQNLPLLLETFRNTNLNLIKVEEALKQLSNLVAAGQGRL